VSSEKKPGPRPGLEGLTKATSGGFESPVLRLTAATTTG